MVWVQIDLSTTLKETYYANFQVHHFVLGYHKIRFTCFSAQETHQLSPTHGINSACMILCCSVMTQKHQIKGRTVEQCGREELLLGWTLTFLTFKIFYLQKNI